jgi:uncharacterized UBP type Zn finger protein
MNKKIMFKEVSVGLFTLELPYKALASHAKKIISKQHGFNEKNIKLIWEGKEISDNTRLPYVLDNQFIVCCVPHKKEEKPNRFVPKSAPVGIQLTKEKKEKVPSNLEQLMEMGFPKEKCEEALKLTNGNINKAVEYLFI